MAGPRRRPRDGGEDRMKRPWFAIAWFAAWGLFQAYAVISVMAGSWQRPEAFPEEAYNALVYPDIFFIPLYLLASVLLFLGKRLGNLLGIFAGGAMVYVMIYLLVLSGLKGANVVFDGVFLAANAAATVQAGRRLYLPSNA